VRLSLPITGGLAMEQGKQRRNMVAAMGTVSRLARHDRFGVLECR
jgi:hypothetical protein